MYILQILFSYGLLQNTGYSSLGYTVGPCWLSSLYIVVCMCQSQPPNLFLPIWRSLHTFLVLFLDMSIFKVLQMVSFKFILCLLLGHSCFCTLTLYPVTLLKYFINSNIYQSSHLDFLHIESLAENNYLDFFFPLLSNPYNIYLFFLPVVLAKASSKMLNRNDGCELSYIQSQV